MRHYRFAISCLVGVVLLAVLLVGSAVLVGIWLAIIVSFL